MIINGLKLTSSNSSQAQPSTLYVREGKRVIAHLKSDKFSNVLGHIRRDSKCEEYRDFVQQCTDGGLTVQDIRALLAG